MYKQLLDNTKEEVEALLALSRQVKFHAAEGYRRRVGANGPNALSRYNVSKWFDWTHAQREAFRPNFPEPLQRKAIQGWFLDIPKGTGFLDLMDYWVGKELSGSVVCTALRKQTILLNRTPLTLEVGEQITFKLDVLHEIKPSKHGQLWACIMYLGDPKQQTD
jgi:hypothetical protein